MRQLLPALLLLILGCAPGDFSPASPQTAGVAASPPYHAYGDSITAGYGLADPAATEYAVLLAQAKTLFLNNHAISGDQACDIPTRQIFPNADSPSTATRTVYTVLIGTNDANAKGAGPYEAVFNLCHQATLAWLATPLQSKVLASAAVTSGPTHIEASSNYNAVTTDAAQATLTFTFSRATPGPVYLWYRIADDNFGTFTYALDAGQPGALHGATVTDTAPAISTHNGSTSSLALLRIPAVPAGPHTLLLTQTSSGVSGMGIVAIGMPASTLLVGSPRVLAGTVPPQLIGSGAPCDTTPAICQAYTNDILANAALLAGDGLDIEIFTAGKYMTATSADLSDALHPNVLGHKEILHAITDIY